MAAGYKNQTPLPYSDLLAMECKPAMQIQAEMKAE
jgi:hypothetical protein